jgi:hypothetical protein
MRWNSMALCIAAMAVAGGVSVGQEPTTSPLFQQWVVARTRVMLVGGRITNGNNSWMFVATEQASVDGPVREQVRLNGGGNVGSLSYTFRRGGGGGNAEHQNDPKLDFALEITSEGRFELRYSDKDHPSRFFSLAQNPGQPITLALPPAEKPRVLRAPTLWHLLIIDGDDCRKSLVPMLESVRPGWHVGLSAQSVEEELVKLAAGARKSDRKQWEAWVKQMGEPVYRTRDKADDHLRKVGPAVLGYLTRLNMNELDAEQKSRVKAIVRSLSTQVGEDTPERVASTLIEDPLIWLALLSRPEEPTRQAAAQQLSVILNEPISVNPKLDPASQVKAREALRTQIEKVVGDSSKTGEEAKPEDPKPAEKKPPEKKPDAGDNPFG